MAVKFDFTCKPIDPKARGKGCHVVIPGWRSAFGGPGGDSDLLIGAIFEAFADTGVTEGVVEVVVKPA